MAIRWGRGADTPAVRGTAPLRGRHAPPPSDAAPQPSATWRLVLRALFEIGGFDRAVLYDVPPSEAPHPLSGTRIFLRGSVAWRRFLANRGQLDDGGLTLLLSLRPLPDTERRLAVDWGARYANTFLLIEPTDPACDLTDHADDTRRTLEDAAGSLLATRTADDDPSTSWTRGTPLGAAARAAFGVWITWPSPDAAGPPERVPLALDARLDTLRAALLPELAARNPPARFEEALAALYERERELFGGLVARARGPFLTRLGLPIPDEPHRVDHALRRLVDQGRAWVFEDGPDPAFFRGRQRRVPDRMTDAEFERLVVR